MYLQDGRIEDAIKTYESIIAARPKDPVPRLALGQLARDRNDPTAAKHHYEEALPLVAAQDREPTLRSLIAVSLDVKDFDAAKKFHRELVKQGQGSLLVRGELGRELEARGEYDRAEAEFRDVVAAAAGDNRTLAPALRDLGRVLSRQHKNTEALATLKRALATAGGEAGVRSEIFALIAEVYRADNNLAELIRLIEDEHPNDFPRLASLGALYEETGQVDKALATYRRALATSPRNIDVRLKVIHLFKRRASSSKPSTSTRRSSARRRTTPTTSSSSARRSSSAAIGRARSPRWSGSSSARRATRTCWSALPTSTSASRRRQRVDRRAHAARHAGSGRSVAPRRSRRSLLPAGRQEEGARDLGRIKTVVPNRAKALATLGEVYLDHDMTTEGVDALKEAMQLEPQNVAYQKAYAVALERTAAASGGSTLGDEGFPRGAARSGRSCSSSARTTRTSRARRARTSSRSTACCTSSISRSRRCKRSSRSDRPTSRRAGCSPRCRRSCTSCPTPSPRCAA